MNYMIGLALVVLCLLPTHAEAPRWLFPAPRTADVKQQRRGPCGVNVNGKIKDSSLSVTEMYPGPLTVTFNEPVNNKGSVFRIALSKEGEDEYEDCVLLDWIPHNDNGDAEQDTRYQLTVNIPDVKCDNCALQLVNVVLADDQKSCNYNYKATENKSNNQCYHNYFSCANIKIKGKTERSKYTCPGVQSNWPWKYNSDDRKRNVYTKMSNPHWQQGLLMDAAAPNSFRSQYADGAMTLAWGTAVGVVRSQDDDAMENLQSDAVMLRDKYLSLASNRLLGLRFDEIALPDEAHIVDARLKLFVDTNTTTSAVNFLLSYEKSEDSSVFEKKNGNINDRELEDGYVKGSIRKGDSIYTSNPSNAQLQELLDNKDIDWETGSAVTVILDVTSDSSSVVKVHTFESGKPAQLHIKYALERVKQGDGTARPTPAPTAKPDQPCTYAAKDRIMGNYLGKGDWYHGRIDEIKKDKSGKKELCTYTVVYDDGDVEEDMTNENLRKETESQRSGFQLRELVDVRVSSDWKRGQIRILQANGKYTVEAMSGEVYANVDQKDIRQWVNYFVDDYIEIKQCWWFAATIKKVIPDGRYECLMDDGYTANVPYHEIREIKDVRYSSGESIKVYVDGKWVRGFVIQENEDGTYMIGISGSNKIEYSWPTNKMAKCEDCSG